MKLDIGAVLSQMDTDAPQLCAIDDAQCARIAARLRAKCRPRRVRRIALIAAVLVLAAAVVGCAVARPDIPVQWYHTLLNGLFDRNVNLVSSNVVSIDLTRLETEKFTITLESTLFTADAAYATFVVDGTLPEDFAISTEILDAPSPGAQKDFWGTEAVWTPVASTDGKTRYVWDSAAQSADLCGDWAEQAGKTLLFGFRSPKQRLNFGSIQTPIQNVSPHGKELIRIRPSTADSGWTEIVISEHNIEINGQSPLSIDEIRALEQERVACIDHSKLSVADRMRLDWYIPEYMEISLVMDNGAVYAEQASRAQHAQISYAYDTTGSIPESLRDSSDGTAHWINTGAHGGDPGTGAWYSYWTLRGWSLDLTHLQQVIVNGIPYNLR